MAAKGQVRIDEIMRISVMRESPGGFYDTVLFNFMSSIRIAWCRDETKKPPKGTRNPLGGGLLAFSSNLFAWLLPK